MSRWATTCSAIAIAAVGVIVSAGPAQAQPGTCLSVDNRLGYDVTVSFDYPAIAPMVAGTVEPQTPTDGPGGAPYISPDGSWTIVAPGQKDWSFDANWRGMPGCHGLWTVRLRP